MTKVIFTDVSSHLPTSLPQALARHRWRFVLSALCSAIAAALALAPFLAVYAVTLALFVDSSPERIPYIAAWTGAALFLRVLATGFATHVGHVGAYRALKELRLALGRKLHRMPLGRVYSRSSGEMKKLLHDDVEQLEEALAHGIPEVAAAVTVPVVTTAVLFVVDWRLALLCVLSLVLLVVVSAVGIILAQKNNRDLAAHALVKNRVIMGYFRGIMLIRSYCRHDVDLDQAQEVIEHSARLSDAATSGPLRWLVAVMGVATSFATALLVPGAGLAYVNGQIPPATLVLFLVVSLGYLTPVIVLVSTLASIAARVEVCARAVQDFLDEPELVESDAPVVPTRFDVSFDKVSFSYTGGVKTLRDVSLQIPQGQSLAIVGATGSGKTTLVRLLARFSDCDEGQIQIGGVNIQDIPMDTLSQSIAFIQQDEYVFADSLMENIRIARPDASDEEVIQAGLAAELQDVVSGLSEGWRTVLSAGGTELSGGQKQRIAVARALVKDASIILLDEATSSLDAVTERRTLRAIRTLTQGRTVIAIAHRLHTIVECDSIAYVSQGSVAALGSHTALLETCPQYAALWDTYVCSDGWRIESQEDTNTPLIHSHDAVHEPLEASRVPVRGESEGIECGGLSHLGFFQQWKACYGRSWKPLMRFGIVRLLLESSLRGVPLLAVLAVIIAALDVVPEVVVLDASLLWVLSIGLILALTIRVLGIAWSNSLVWKLSSKAKADLELSIVERAKRVPLGDFHRMDTGRLATLVTSEISMLDFQNLPQQVIGACIQPIYAIAVLMIIDWRLAIVTLSGLPVFWLATVWSDRIYQSVFVGVHSARQEATAAMLEQAQGAAVLRSNPGARIDQRYETAMRRLESASISMSVRAIPSTLLGTLSLEGGQVLLLLLGSSLYMSGSVQAAQLVVFLLLSLVIYQPIQELNALAGYRRHQQQIAQKIAHVWDTQVLSEPENPLVAQGASVELSHVSFSYREGERVLHDVSFRAEEGQITALVGPSGSGKSTIAHLISRMWDVDAGSIGIGGVDVRDLGSRGLVDNVTAVFQDVFFFDDSVRANLLVGNNQATDEDLWDALEAAQCAEVVRAMPEGLDTRLAENGANFSAGQRQRLAIARALVKNSPVLILDESVASVDPSTEDRIHRAIGALISGRTVIVIAHRISTVQNAHRIVVLDNGTLAGVGSHDQLIRTCPLYCSLAQEQDLGENPTTVPMSETSLSKESAR